MACYVVLSPEQIRGIYDTWAACEAAVRGMPGAVYRKAADRALAERLLGGEGRKLEPGTYAFVDGNHRGGIGVVFVHRREDGSTATKEIATTVAEVWPDLAGELVRLRNPLAEIAGMYAGFQVVQPRAPLTVVHDYEGTGAWMEGRWKTRDVIMERAVARCLSLRCERMLSVRFVHTNGHQSAVGDDEYAQYNARADALATAAVAGA